MQPIDWINLTLGIVGTAGTIVGTVLEVGASLRTRRRVRVSMSMVPVEGHMGTDASVTNSDVYFDVRVTSAGQALGIQHIWVEIVENQPSPGYSQQTIMRLTDGPTQPLMPGSGSMSPGGIVQPDTVAKYAIEIRPVGPGMIVQAKVVSATPKRFGKGFETYTSQRILIDFPSTFWETYLTSAPARPWWDRG